MGGYDKQLFQLNKFHNFYGYISQYTFVKLPKTVKGKKYIQHQLIESIRTPAGPRQRLILNLGFLDLHQGKWKELADTIESEIHKQPRLFVTDAQIEKLAKHYAKVIVREKLNKESHTSVTRCRIVDTRNTFAVIIDAFT